MKHTTKQRVGALVVWALLILLTRYDGWYEMPVSIVPSWTKTLIGTSIIMIVGLRLRKLYWAKFIEKLGALDE